MKWMTSAALICFLSLPASAEAASPDQGGFFSSFMNQIFPSNETEPEAEKVDDVWAEAQLEVEAEENQTEEERLHEFDEAWASFPSGGQTPAFTTPLTLFTAASAVTNGFKEPEAPEAIDPVSTPGPEEQTDSSWDAFDEQWDDFGSSFDAARQEEDSSADEPALFQEAEETN